MVLMENVVTVNSNGLDFVKKKWVAEHLSQRIDSALSDPNVDMDAFLGLLQTYNKHVLMLKQSHMAKCARRKACS